MELLSVNTTEESHKIGLLFIQNDKIVSGLWLEPKQLKGRSRLERFDDTLIFFKHQYKNHF